MDPPIYREEQRFREPWLWILVAVSAIPAFAIVGYITVEQLLFGRPVGNRPVSDTGLILLIAILFAVNGLIFGLFYYAKLVTEVRRDGLWIRYIPFHRRFHHIAGIERSEVRTYDPLLEYGGWGIRWGFKGGKAYNVSGDRGVQLHLQNGKSLLIGSQRPEELQAALQQLTRD